MDAAAGVLLIVLHMLDGRAVAVNPAQIVSLLAPREVEDPSRQLHTDVRCVVSVTNGKFVSVTEDCDTVRKMLEGK